MLDPGWVHMLPHFGSTAITGITVFVFRMVILLLVGKAYAGNLFTAFAIGGILGSVFAQALGPTLVFHAKEGLVSDIPRWLKACLLGSVGLGIALLATEPLQFVLYQVDAKDPVVFGVIVLTLGVTGFFASLIPASRVTKLDPIAALRVD